LTAAWPIAREGRELRVSARGSIARASSRCSRRRRFLAGILQALPLWPRDRRDRLRTWAGLADPELFKGQIWWPPPLGPDNGYCGAWGVTCAEESLRRAQRHAVSRRACQADRVAGALAGRRM